MYSMHCAFARAVLPCCYYTYWCTVQVGCTCTRFRCFTVFCIVTEYIKNHSFCLTIFSVLALYRVIFVLVSR